MISSSKCCIFVLVFQKTSLEEDDGRDDKLMLSPWRVRRKCDTSYPVRRVFFCFRVSAISVFEVSCHRRLDCSRICGVKTYNRTDRADF